MILSPETLAASYSSSAAGSDAVISTAEGVRLCRFDGRTHVLFLHDAEGWLPLKRLRWTRPLLAELRARNVREVLLRRGLTRGRVPLTWFPDDEES